MKKRIAPAVLVLCLLGLLGSCTTAGPFVTSISSDGKGNLVIEKSMVKMNAFMGTVSTEPAGSVTVRVVEEK